MNTKNAFSLIELMIVIAIVGILAAISIPSYKNYVVRANVLEAITAAESKKADIAERYSLNGAMPCCGYGNGSSNGFVAMADISPNISNLLWFTASTTQGRIEVRFSPNAPSQLAGNIITLTLDPNYLNKDSLVWICGVHPTSTGILKYMPSNCQSTSF